jgi:mono/diheme cytochrome c family protein
MRRLICLHVLGFALVGAHTPARATDPAPLSSAATRKLYIGKCAKCHKLYDPAQYSALQWEMWMGKMTKKARLTDTQQQQLNSYIENTLRHPAPDPSKPEPIGRTTPVRLPR